MSQTVLDIVTKKFGDKIQTRVSHDDEIIVAPAKLLLELAEFLRTDEKLLFDAPVFVSCVDRLGLAGFGELPDADRFEVCFQLRSTRHNHRVRIAVSVPEDKPALPSLSNMYPGFNWQERETFDMYGIEFEGHTDLRRIYMYDEFVGYPLRKDYPKDKRQPLVRRDWAD